MKMYELKNGTTVAQGIYGPTILMIKQLANTKAPISTLAIYDLGKKALNSSYKISPECEAILKKYKLLEIEGEMSSVVKNIVQSTISFNGEFPVLDLDHGVVKVLGDD